MTTTICKARNYITTQDLADWAKELPRDGVNPMRDNPGAGCAYVGPKNAHCIAGEFFSDHGITDEQLSDQEGVSADQLAKKFGFSAEVAGVLWKAQRIADQFSHAHANWGYKTEPWGQATDYIVEEAARLKEENEIQLKEQMAVLPKFPEFVLQPYAVK